MSLQPARTKTSRLARTQVVAQQIIAILVTKNTIPVTKIALLGEYAPKARHLWRGLNGETTRQVSSVNPGNAASCHATSADMLTSVTRKHNAIMTVTCRQLRADSNARRQ